MIFKSFLGKIFLAGFLFLYFSNSYAQQSVHKKKAELRHTEFKFELDKISKSSLTEQKKYSDSLLFHLKSNQEQFKKDFTKYFNSQALSKSDSLNRLRKDTLNSFYISSLKSFVGNEVPLEMFSKESVKSNNHFLAAKKKIFSARINHSEENYKEDKDLFKEVADSIKSVIKDSCLSIYNNLNEQLADKYSMVKDSLNDLCSDLIQRQITEKEILDELKATIADSLAEIKADSIRFYKPTFSFYSSLTLGYDRNPLYFYKMVGDQTRQLFVQSKFYQNYSHSRLDISYVGSLMTFNKIEERNYYDHILNSQYRIDFTDQSASQSSKKYSDELNMPENENTSNITFALNLSGRHDKAIFNDYNNYGLEFVTQYKNRADSSLIYNLKNVFGYRYYLLVPELTNITELVQFDLAKVSSDKYIYGVSVSGGMKYYLTTVYDTTITTTTNNGGKTQTQISLKAQPNGTYQFALGLIGSKKWLTTSLESKIQYRYNIKSQGRYLNMYINTPFLFEDIYNDNYSYQGPEWKVDFTKQLFWAVDFTASSLVQYCKMNIPAFNLADQKTASNRIDIRSYVEFQLSKFVELSDKVSIDFSLDLSLTRNQSNDLYNDFSSYTAAFGFGIGF